MIGARTPDRVDEQEPCAGCRGSKGAPIAGIISVGDDITFPICQECGRDLANAVGFMCVREGGWSKLEPRKRRGAK